LGLFGAVAVVIAILAGAATGVLVLLERSMQDKVNTAKTHLAELHDQMEIQSIDEAKKLQERIARGYALLDKHVYSSQAFIFVEQNILDNVDLKSFSYGDGKIHVDAVANGYLEYAQQIRYLRTVKNITGFTVSSPALDAKTGLVNFSLDITLSDAYIHTKPGSAGAATPPASDTTTQPEDNMDSNL
jgi:hypothetical protein